MKIEAYKIEMLRWQKERLAYIKALPVKDRPQASVIKSIEDKIKEKEDGISIR